MSLENELKFVEIERWTTSLRVVPYHLSIILECTACKMRRPIERQILNQLADGQDDIPSIEQRLRCTCCGKKHGRIAFGDYARVGDV